MILSMTTKSNLTRLSISSMSLTSGLRNRLEIISPVKQPTVLHLKELTMKVGIEAKTKIL